MAKSTFTLSLLLVLSIAINVLLWLCLNQRHYAAQTTAVPAALAANTSPPPPASDTSEQTDSNALEIARLRGEVTRLKSELNSRPVASSASAPAHGSDRRFSSDQLLMNATQELARAERFYDRLAKEASELNEDLTTASPERLLELQRIAQSNKCINNLKHIALAARIWANDHGDRFPPDFLTMRAELETPKILFCPGSSTPVAADWPALNIASVSYRFVNPNGSDRDPSQPLCVCPIHGNTAFSDGSAQKPPRPQ